MTKERRKESVASDRNEGCLVGCDEAHNRARVGGTAGARRSRERGVGATSPAGLKTLRCGYARASLRRNVHSSECWHMSSAT